MYSERNLVMHAVTCAHGNKQARTQRTTPIMTFHRISYPEPQIHSHASTKSILHSYATVQETAVPESVWAFSLNLQHAPHQSLSRLIVILPGYALPGCKCAEWNTQADLPVLPPLAAWCEPQLWAPLCHPQLLHPPFPLELGAELDVYLFLRPVFLPHASCRRSQGMTFQ